MKKKYIYINLIHIPEKYFMLINNLLYFQIFIFQFSSILLIY